MFHPIWESTCTWRFSILLFAISFNSPSNNIPFTPKFSYKLLLTKKDSPYIHTFIMSAYITYLQYIQPAGRVKFNIDRKENFWHLIFFNFNFPITHGSHRGQDIYCALEVYDLILSFTYRTRDVL